MNLNGKKVSESTTEQLHCVRYPHLNSLNRLYGGQLLAWIDELGAATARRHCGHDVITVSIDNLHFKSGAYLNDMIFLIGNVTYVGRTSMEIRVDTYREDYDGKRYPINRAYLVMVAIGTDGKPTEVPPLLLENVAQEMEWNNAIKRKELRQYRRQEGY